MKPEAIYLQDNTWWLGVDVCDRNNRHIYTMTLSKLHSVSGNNGEEVSLNGGRFKTYTHNKQEYSVTFKKHNDTQESIHKHMTEILEWIANNIEDRWSLDVEINDVSHLRLIFSFEDAVQAMFFRFLFA